MATNEIYTGTRLYWLVVGTLLLAALCSAWVLFVPAPDSYMTEFYMLGEQGKAEDYPRQALIDQDISVTLGIVNREREAHTYHVEVWVSDLWQADRRAMVQQATFFELAPDESWNAPIRWRMPWLGEDQRVEVLLFNEEQSVPYRQLLFGLDVTEGRQ